MACGILPSRPLIDKAVRSILARQLPDGGFNIYARGPSEISATVKAYTALKLAGLDYDDPHLTRARERILALGGLQHANSYVKVNLSLFGLYPREHTPPSRPSSCCWAIDLRDVVVDAGDRDSAVDRPP
jgi:squalene-hopene/tetraprenyl-beta-curcumene cyclase